MERSRMEAFSDGVLAIIITIMVLNLKVPVGSGFSDIKALLPQLGGYALSFAYIGAYWSNHHHTVHAVTTVNGKILWANLLFLFFISLLPAATDWLGMNLYKPVPTFVYGLVLFLTAMSFFLLRFTIITEDHCSHALRKAMNEDWRGIATGITYVTALALAMFFPKISLVLYTFLLLIWFMPDHRIEKNLKNEKKEINCEEDES